MKIIVAGSRTFTNYHWAEEMLDRYLTQIPITEVVCGCAAGTDRMAERWAIERSLPITRFPTNWKEHGRQAGILRNIQMAKYADQAVLFWNGRSPGTRHMLQTMNAYKKPAWIVPIE